MEEKEIPAYCLIFSSVISSFVKLVSFSQFMIANKIATILFSNVNNMFVKPIRPHVFIFKECLADFEPSFPTLQQQTHSIFFEVEEYHRQNMCLTWKF